MARIVLADDGLAFDGRSPEAGPLGGAETSVVYLARELARRGHAVGVYNCCPAPLTHDGVTWTPLDDTAPRRGLPAEADLYIANRGQRLIDLMPGAGRSVFWVHNPARYLLKWRYLSRLWRVRPVVVFVGEYHATTYPRWAPDGGRVVIPLGIGDQFRVAKPNNVPPPPRAIFTSNPLRSLDWLLDLWSAAIRPAVPGAELHLFSGFAAYGSLGTGKRAAIEKVLDRARALSGDGVVLHDPVPKAGLAAELRASRVMLYRGDASDGGDFDTFCLAVGEAQAMGVPAVVQNKGAVAERIVDGKTGFAVLGDAAFADAACRLLGDDELWRAQHAACLERRRVCGWDEAAAAFERLIP